MYFTNGSYSTPVGSSWFSMNFTAILGQTNRKIGERQRWSIHTVLTASTQNALDTLIDSHIDNMKQSNADLTFYRDDGTESPHKIVNAQTDGGVQWKGYDLPGYFPGQWGANVESLYLRYIVTHHEALVFDVENNIIFLWHSMQYSLGGFDYAVPGALNGPPQFQITMLQSPFWAIQQGRAIGMYSNPIAPGPIVNAPPSPRESYIREETPTKWGRLQNWGFPTAWRYFYRSPGPLNATPPTTF